MVLKCVLQAVAVRGSEMCTIIYLVKSVDIVAENITTNFTPDVHMQKRYRENGWVIQCSQTAVQQLLFLLCVSK